LSNDKELKLDDALFNFCFEDEIDTAQLSDRRTEDIIMNYQFYKNVPHIPFDNQIWFESVIMLNKIFEPQRLF